MSTDTPPPSSEPKARQTTIRSKLLAALALPVLAVALITGFQANNAQGDLNRTKDQVELALSAGGPTSYLSALLYERNETALYMLGLDKAISLGGVTSVPEARRETDKAKKAFDAAIASKNAQVRGLFADAQAQSAAKLSSVRNLADADTGTRGSTNSSVVPVYDTYTAVIQTLIDANFNVVAQIDDAKLHNYAHSIAEYTKSTNLDSRMLRQVVLPKITGEPADTFTTGHMLTESDLTQQQLITDLEADPAAHKVAEAYFGRKVHTTFIDQITDFVKTGNTVDIQAVIASAAATTGNSLANAQLNALNSRGNDLVDAAKTSRNLYVAIFVIATGLSVLFALIIAQSISKPLVKIADEAREMATSRLPEAVRGVLATPLGEDVIQPKLEPITVTSTDETALVAASINDVQQRALDLAVEQAAQRRNFADTFLNLGRRVQGLVNRQLEFITDLEDDERDPEVLENLFKLDHLATRIRRNAESLVVLAGVTRRVRSGDPIPVIDVLRSALGEVDEYTRVRIDEVDEARLPLSVAADLSHILAELIENGLNFSPPETDVLTVGVREPDGYRITVADHGIGMDVEQVATANRRLSGNESFTVAPSRYMGHFVAGHLATSLGISVQVTSSPNGTTATIIVANSLLVGDSKAGTGDLLDEAAQDDGTSVLEGVGATSSAGAVNGTSSPAPRNDDSFKPAAPPRAPAIGSLGDLLSTHRRLSDSRETPGDSANH